MHGSSDVLTVILKLLYLKQSKIYIFLQVELPLTLSVSDFSFYNLISSYLYFTLSHGIKTGSGTVDYPPWNGGFVPVICIMRSLLMER